MTSTTHKEFDENTEAIEVANALSNNVRGKTILVTGVNPKGIGYATAEAFASQSVALIIVAGRSLSKLQESTDTLKAEFPKVEYRNLQLDLSNQRTVRSAADQVLSWNDVTNIDVIVNSAGVMNLPERTINEDGIEMQFATNYIGHYLFTCLIMPKLLKAAESSPKGATRIINVSSLSPTVAGMRWSDINFEKVNKELPSAEQPPYEMHRAWGTRDPENASYLPLEGYNQSKVANVLFSIGANERLYEKHGILSLTVHPGIIMTELGRNAPPEIVEAIGKMVESKAFSFRTLGAGAATSVVAALDPKLGRPETKDGQESFGVYLMDCQISERADPRAVSSSEAERLWQLSEKLVGEKFAW